MLYRDTCTVHFMFSQQPPTVEVNIKLEVFFCFVSLGKKMKRIYGAVWALLASLTLSLLHVFLWRCVAADSSSASVSESESDDGGVSFAASPFSPVDPSSGWFFVVYIVSFGLPITVAVGIGEVVNCVVCATEDLATYSFTWLNVYMWLI